MIETEIEAGYTPFKSIYGAYKVGPLFGAKLGLICKTQPKCLVGILGHPHKVNFIGLEKEWGGALGATTGDAFVQITEGPQSGKFFRVKEGRLVFSDSYMSQWTDIEKKRYRNYISSH